MRRVTARRGETSEWLKRRSGECARVRSASKPLAHSAVSLLHPCPASRFALCFSRLLCLLLSVFSPVTSSPNARAPRLARRRKREKQEEGKERKGGRSGRRRGGRRRSGGGAREERADVQVSTNSFISPASPAHKKGASQHSPRAPFVRRSVCHRRLLAQADGDDALATAIYHSGSSVPTARYDGIAQLRRDRRAPN